MRRGRDKKGEKKGQGGKREGKEYYPTPGCM
jgi:hypothetical protein